jgi:hypothetical protein
MGAMRGISLAKYFVKLGVVVYASLYWRGGRDGKSILIRPRHNAKDRHLSPTHYYAECTTSRPPLLYEPMVSRYISKDGRNIPRDLTYTDSEQP